jgi:predicted membrane GTPase involved in stress response
VSHAPQRARAQLSDSLRASATRCTHQRLAARMTPFYMLGERLMKEAERNVAITVKQSEARDAYEVGGRGELQMGVLIETMRREGFELSISRPRVL